MLCNDNGEVCCDLCRKRQEYADEGRCYDTDTFGSCDGCLVCSTREMAEAEDRELSSDFQPIE